MNDWSTGQFALEVQTPWSRLLLEGKKEVEARAYSLPQDLLGRSILLLESTTAQDSIQSGLADRFQTSSIIGTVIFSEIIEYTSEEQFRMDEASHLVPAESPFGWRIGTERLYGWKIQDTKLVEEKETVWVERRMRSLFQVIIP